VLLHEAVGHGLEADFNRKGTSNYSGRIGPLPARSSPSSTTGRSSTRAAPSTSTTKATRRRATPSSRAEPCAATSTTR
jgi:hypothetical protein